jgi:hypothetical protein
MKYIFGLVVIVGFWCAASFILAASAKLVYRAASFGWNLL